ncbi:MAG: hypothetical protein QOE28_251, partial [Solirubrobacteraceae bacterium]|nr:hypothetical protein [Solirubrobacteraceae bacterium]
MPLLHDRRRAHVATALSLFAGLGFHVGLWAVLIPDVASAAHLGPAALGACIGLVSLSGMGALLLGGPLSDRLGRRPVAVCGCAGLAAAFAVLSAVGPVSVLLAGLVLLGISGGLLDLAANATGSDYERTYAVKAMTGLHAAFSAAAAAGALAAALILTAGGTFRVAFLCTTAVLLALGAAATRAPLPPHAEPGPPPSQAEPDAPDAGPVWRIPGVAFGLALAGACFLGDGMLEGFSSLYLRGTLASGALLGG